MKPQKEIHQLTDFKIDEVSLVDHAANKRRFVILKREGNMPEDTDIDVNDSSEAAATPSTSAIEPAPEPTASATGSDPKPLLDMLQQIKAVVSELAARSAAPIAANDDVEVVKSLKGRIDVLEKSFGLPASHADEGGRSTHEAHGWPFDINEKQGA